MRVLITGAAGFLGRHVMRHLGNEGFEVTGFDKAPSDLDLPVVQGDLLDEESITSAASGQDVICHIGAIGDVYLAGENPALAASVNVTGSAHVAKAAASAEAKVIYASTWEVYGEPQFEPITEDHPCQPDHPYNITKLAGEQLLLAADSLHGLPVTALRLGTAYGSGLRPNSVFRIFIDRALAGEPITIQGDGSQTRQFTHARDIARAFEAACRSAVHGRAFNIVASEPVSIKQLADVVTARIPTEVHFGEQRPGDVPPSLVSAERAREDLGWSAQVDFEDGIDELIESLAG